VRGICLEVGERSWASMPKTLASVKELRSAPTRIDRVWMNEGGGSYAHHATARADRNHGPQYTHPISTFFGF
jgi:hypothetical protein